MWTAPTRVWHCYAYITHRHISHSTRVIDDCKKIFRNSLSIEASDRDCEVIRRVCEAISTRAAQLAAVGVVVLAKKSDKISGCNVAVDGSLYKQHPKFAERYYNFLYL